jgi:hypothetical protein
MFPETHLFRRVVPVGSRVICNPPPTDTDADYLCLVALGGAWDAEMALYSAGYERGGSEDPLTWQLGPEREFTSYRKGEINLIVTDSPEYFRRFLTATVVATRLNLLKKDDRIALHRAVLYGMA